MPKKKVEVYNKDELIYPFIESDHVTFSNGMKVSEMLNQSISMPTVVHEDLSFKVGVGDQDVSSSIVDSSVSEMTIKGKTYQNILPEPSTHVLTNNKEMFKVNEGLDPNVEIVDGVSKSAILKGQTLVNLIDYSSPLNANITKNNDTLTITSQTENAWFSSAYKLIGVTYEKKYCVMWDSLTYTHTDSHGAEQIIGIYSSDSNNNKKQVTIAYNRNDNSNYFEFTVPSNAKIENVTIRIHATTYSGKQGNTTTVKGLKVLEYQQGMENWDIPYFEGMQSVKMPVLTTTGKNLFDWEKLTWHMNRSQWSHGSGGLGNKNAIGYQGTTGTISDFNLQNDKTYFTNAIISFYADDTFEQSLTGTQTNTFIVPNNAQYFAISKQISNEAITNITNPEIILTEGSTATSYEPYKSNILSTPEEVVLRSLPNGVCDTLNLNTGEYVQRIGEIVLDGSQELINFYNHSAFSGASGYSVQYKLIDISSYNDYNLPCDKLICDKLKNLSHSAMDRTVQYGITSTQLNSINLLLIKLPYDYSPNPSLATFKEYLSQNPITVQYELATPVVKTIDLSSSGNWETIVFNGSENWSVYPRSSSVNFVNTIAFQTNTIPNAISTENLQLFSESFRATSHYGSDVEGIFMKGTMRLSIKKSRLMSQDVDGLKQYLQQNPLTVWYQTVVHQDSTRVKQPIFFKDGYIIQSSGADNSLIPTLDYQAKTSNSYVMDLMKTGTTYTMKASGVSGTATIGNAGAFTLNTNRTFTSPASQSLFDNKLLVIKGSATDLMIIEGDVTSKTIPYFKGIKSAFEGEDKIEVLSTGKNLFDKNKVFYGKSTNGNGELIDSPPYVTSDLISVKPNTNYTVKHLVVVSMYDKNGSYISGLNADHEQRTFTTPSNCSYIRIRNWGLLDTVELQKEVLEKTVLQEGDSIETYEPYKSNSTKIPLLSPLRSLPNGVCDELIIDRMKKKATLIQRVGKVVLNGSENWTQSQIRDKHYVVMLGRCSEVGIPEKYPSTLLCSHFINQQPYAYDREGINVHVNYNFHIGFLKNRLSKVSVGSCKKWLSQNPTTVYYELEIPVITEVDLEGFPYIYKDGHIFLNSEIAPTTEIIYSINQCQQISASNEDIIRHEKELTYLQKLIAQYVQVDYESVLLSLKV